MRSFVRFLAKCLATVLLICVVAVVATVGWFIWHYEYEIGLPTAQQMRAVSSADRICSSEEEKSEAVPLSAVPPLVRAAVLAAEDPEFYRRPPITNLIRYISFGLDHYRRISARVERPVPSPAISTVASRCLISLSPDCCDRQPAFERMMTGIVFFCRVEKSLSKDRIFEIYLNETYFGRDSYGIAAAARVYFGKTLSDLNIEDAAYLAALPRAEFRRNRERGIERRNWVIERMRSAGAITDAEASFAKQQPLLLREFPAKT